MFEHFDQPQSKRSTNEYMNEEGQVPNPASKYV